MARENLIISVRADGTRRVRREMKGIGEESRRAQKGVDILRKALLFVGTAAAIGGIVRTLANFSQEISTVRAITNATAEEFRELRDRATDLGATTRFTATQAAEGLQQLARSGFDVRKSIDTVDDTLRLAQAGALDLGTAARITAGTIRGFRVSTDEAERFVDVLATTANSSATTVTDLGEALKFTAPAAASLKVPFETASAALGVLADNQLRGTIGGTGLRKVLSILAKGGKPLQQALKEVGLGLSDVDVKSIGLVEALRNLEKANIDTGDAFLIFGDRGQPAFDVLVNNIPKLVEFEEKLKSSGGEARRIAEIMDYNLNGGLLRVKSALEAVVLSFGDLGAESGLTVFLNELADTIRTFAKDADAMAGALTTLGLVALPIVLAGIRALTAAILRNPIALLSVGIAFAIGKLVEFRDEIIVSEDGITSLGDVASAVFEKMSGLFEIVKEASLEAIEIFVQTWNAVFGTDLPATFEGFVKAVASGIDFVIGVFSGVGAVISTAFSNPLETAGFLILEFANLMITAFNGLFRRISLILQKLKDTIIQLLSQIPGIAQSTLDTVANTRVQLPQIPQLKQEFEDQGRTMGDAFKIGFDKSTQASEFASDVFTRANEIGNQRVSEADRVRAEAEERRRLRAALEGQADALGELKDKQKEVNDEVASSKNAFNTFREGIQAARLDAETFAASLADIVVGAVQSLSDAIADAVVDGIQNFEDFKTALSEIFKQIAKQIISLIIQFLILEVVSAITGGAPGSTGATRSASSSGSSGRQAGGPVTSGKPVVVGEQGPELFVPPSNGMIKPNSQTPQGGGQAAVTVINVSDPNEVPAALETQAGEQAVLNVLSKNRRQVNQLIQGGA